MAIKVEIKEELSAGVFRACGSYSDSAGNSGEAEVIVKAHRRKASLILAPELGNSRIMGKKVMKYGEHPQAKSAKKIETGVKLVFENVPMQLKNYKRGNF